MARRPRFMGRAAWTAAGLLLASALSAGVAGQGPGRSGSAAAAAAAQAPGGPKATAWAAVDRNAAEIAKVGDAIFSFAELGMQEVETAGLCARLLGEMGYTVETGIAGIPTAIR